MLVKYAMEAKPLHVPPQTKLRDILDKILASDQETTAVVADDGRLLGIVGVHDVLRQIVPAYLDMDDSLSKLIHDGYFVERFTQLAEITAADIMNTQAETIAPDDTIIHAAALFVERRRKALPVVERGHFVSMITRRSLLNRVASKLV